MRRNSEHVQNALALLKGKKGSGWPRLTWWTSIAYLIKKTQLPIKRQTMQTLKDKKSRPYETWKRAMEKE